jgi:hypothetical protein
MVGCPGPDGEAIRRERRRRILDLKLGICWFWVEYNFNLRG